MRIREIAIAIGGLLVLSQLPTAAPGEVAITVPGYADFLAVDGVSVWITNQGRVERWSLSGKLSEVAVSEPCGTMAIAANSLWVANCKDKTLHRIDLKTTEITATIATGIASPDGEMNVVAGAGSIWLASEAGGVIARIDPAFNRVAASIAVDPASNFLAFGYGSLWAVSSAHKTLQKIDPETNAVVARTALGNQPGFLAAGEGSVWVQEQLDGTVARIDPETAKVTGRVKVGETLKYGDIDAGGGKVWLRTTKDQTYVVIDPGSLAILARVGKPSGSGALRHVPQGVWTTAHDLQRLSWWDSRSGINESAGK